MLYNTREYQNRNTYIIFIIKLLLNRTLHKKPDDVTIINYYIII